MNARSPLSRSVLSEAAKAATGRATTTRTATKTSVGRTRCRSDCRVTVAEMEIKSTPIISCTRVSKNGRRAGISKPCRLTSASPMKIAAMSPVSSRSASHPAATATTAASCALVLSTSPSRSQCRGQHPGDEYPEDDQADHHLAGVTPQFAQIQPQARVIQDDRHRQGHQWLERRSKQVLWIDVARQRARDETGGQQEDERGNAQPAGKHLRADREQNNKSESDQDLCVCHASLR
jgi:hypothetical protein